MKRAFRWYDSITINSFWFALTARSQMLSALLVPLLVQQYMGESAKGAYLGRMRLWSLMTALLMQALMGMLSDRSTSRWGRRRPFIVAGALGEALILILMGFAVGMEGLNGYMVLLVLYILSSLFSNTAQSAVQGLIPDVVPHDKRGIVSGVKALFEVPLPMIFVSLVIGKMISRGNISEAITAIIATLIVCMLITLLVPEERLKRNPAPFDWQPFLRLFIMTGCFTLIIVGTGALVKRASLIELSFPSLPQNVIIAVTAILGMTTAVVLGVWASVRISVGKEIRQRKAFTWWVTNRLAFLVGATNLGSFILYFLQERFPELQGEKAAGPASTLIMFVGFTILLSALPSGWLSDRIGKKNVLMISALLATAGTAIVITGPTLTAFYIGGALAGIGIGFFYSANWALGTEIVPPNQAGRFLGLSNLAGAGAGAIGAYIGGPIGDQLGYGFLLGIYGTMFILSMLALKGIPDKNYRSAEKSQA
ncbi:MAG: MFS transporter [Anaerolineaceae bacterium]|nr:MFS transporter [Anaerolineaceae bacterium]